ncbi:endonuclease V [Legionella fallonii]
MEYIAGIDCSYYITGHGIGQEKIVELVLQYLTKYRLPEPPRIADKMS